MFKRIMGEYVIPIVLGLMVIAIMYGIGYFIIEAITWKD